VKRTLLILIPAGALAAAAWYGVFNHQAPSGQPALADMELAALRADFNRAADHPRLIVLLSPT
jgi:hypothetical protein